MEQVTEGERSMVWDRIVWDRETDFSDFTGFVSEQTCLAGVRVGDRLKTGQPMRGSLKFVWLTSSAEGSQPMKRFLEHLSDDRRITSICRQLQLAPENQQVKSFTEFQLKELKMQPFR